MNLTEMTDAEIDSMAAERLGFKVLGVATCFDGSVYPDTEPSDWTGGGSGISGKRPVYQDDLPDPWADDETIQKFNGVSTYALKPVKRYSTDISAAFELQAEIERRGKRQSFCDALRTLIPFGYFEIIHATPRQRTIAFLLATEGK